MTVDGPLFVYSGENVSTQGDSEVGTDHYHQAYKNSVYAETCPYCDAGCRVERASTTYGGSGWRDDFFAACDVCGWWSYKSDGDTTDGNGSFESYAATMKSFSVGSDDLPIQSLASYAAARENLLRSISPSKLEELVGAIYSDVLGYRVEFCSYARPDKGIDLVVINAEGQTQAIQVKRHARPIELGSIHQFYGALVSADRRTGVFVTTGRFRSGAKHEAGRLTSKSQITIDLIDGKRLLEFVGVLNSKRRRAQPSDFAGWMSHVYFNQGAR
jgi:hypothetical protein